MAFRPDGCRWPACRSAFGNSVTLNRQSSGHERHITGVQEPRRVIDQTVAVAFQTEQEARQQIDEQLSECGWVVQHYHGAAVAAAQGVAVREVPTPGGRADYVLYVDQQAVGVIEAKKPGTTLTGVEWQTRKYQQSYPGELPAFRVEADGTVGAAGVLPFAYESTGVETRFTCGLDPKPTSRRVFTFHRPETLARLQEDHVNAGPLRGATFRAGVQLLPDLDAPESGDTTKLWAAQREAIANLEASLKDNRPRALIQMATGSGKTFTAANVCYRLIRHAGAKRILFLVDRANLGRQTIREFEGFTTPDDGRKFTELYTARHLNSSAVDIGQEGAVKVHVATIQRVYSILCGTDHTEDLDEQSGFDVAPRQPVEVSYNPSMPIESYDVIIIDECHRSIYGTWRQVLEYFDAFLIGLTATPGKQTFGFFDQNMVMEYGHERAVAERVNVDFDVFRIRTEISETGGTIKAEQVTEFRDRETRQLRLEKIDEDITYDSDALDRKVVAPDQIRTIMRTLRDSMPDMFPHRRRTPDGLLEHIPKTLIFAKDDSHADDIVQTVREEFGLSNMGAVKITYTSASSGNKPEDLLQAFRTSYDTRVAVTVDMIATGTDVKPIECVVFMRLVRSRNFFEQMKGRGVRVIDPAELQVVTPDAAAKDRFVLVDCVGVTETGLADTVPLERQPHVTFRGLLNQVGLGSTSDDVASSLASRLMRLDKRMTAPDRKALEQEAGISLADLAANIVDALSPDRRLEEATVEAGGVEPDAKQLAGAAKRLVAAALEPIAGNPNFRFKLIEVQSSYEQIIDAASQDQVITSEFSKDATERAKRTIISFREFIEENRDEITALQVLYSQPHGHGLTFAQVRELADAISRPPRSWTPAALWEAYETLDASKVRGSGHRVQTDLISLVRHALGQSDELVAYPDLVNERFETWLFQQSKPTGGGVHR